MNALILFSHGSVLCGAGETLKWHAERLRQAGEYPVVEVGYMNYSRPPFAEAVEKCAAAGATRIIVTPYFLVPGKFVRVDLPTHIKTASELWPDIEFVIASPIGFDEKLADAILQLAQNAHGPEHWREDYLRASDFCEANPQCPLFATPRCPRVPAPVLQESLA